MFHKLSERLSYANVVGTAALVIAVAGGGVATAAAMVPRNSVASPQIVNNAVKSVDVKNDGLSGTDINESSLGQVPDASHANNADNANNANTAGTANGLSSGAINNPNVFGSGDLGVVRAYAWNNLLNTSGSLTNNGWTYNRSGGEVTVTHNSAGNYTVTFAGLNLSGGHIQVTGYGGGANWCKVGGWSSSAATVLCFDSAGAPVNSLFTIAAID